MKLRNKIVLMAKAGTVVFLLLMAFVIFVETNYKSYRSNVFYDDCRFVWGHRGHWKNMPQGNTLESFNRAFELGAKGVEMDIFYDEKLDTYIVSHHKPYHRIDGKLILLKDILNELKGKGYFWLDLKEIENIKDLEKAADTLIRILSNTHLMDKAIVESPSGYNLRVYSLKGIYTSYWFQFNDDQMGWLRYLVKDYIRKFNLSISKFSAISMPYYTYNKRIAKDYAAYPLHLFTVNELAQINAFKGNHSIKVILSDEDFFNQKKINCN